MELKPHQAQVRKACDTTFNRTTMELKQSMRDAMLYLRIAFNRTTMELKLMRTRNGLSATPFLLIEPLWN